MNTPKNISIVRASFNTHNNWKIIEDHMEKHLRADTKITFVSFVESAKCFRSNKMISGKWVGILHDPPNSHKFFPRRNILKNRFFINNLENCVGLFCMSDSLRDWLIENLNPTFFVKVLYHPMSSKALPEWDYNEFKKSRSIYQIGNWLRVPYFIFKLDAQGYEKYVIPCKQRFYRELHRFMRLDGVKLTDHDKRSVNGISYISDDKYNEMHKNSIVAIKLYASTCNNVIMECITNNCPILINRLPEIEVYLGEDYPLFYDTIEQAEELLKSDDAILRANEYLKRLDKTRFTIKYFMDSINEELSKIN